jgi:hypothetical protein
MVVTVSLSVRSLWWNGDNCNPMENGFYARRKKHDIFVLRLRETTPGTAWHHAPQSR